MTIALLFLVFIYFLSLPLFGSLFNFNKTALNTNADDITYWDGTTPTADANCTFSGGTGITGDPYLISSASDLAQLSANINSSTTNSAFKSLYYKLTTDIYLNDETFTFNADTGLVAVSNGCYLGTGIKGDNTGLNTTFDTTASARGTWYSNSSGTTTTAPSGLNLWSPIGITSTYYFAGNFDGNSHTVSGIYINTTSNYQGLFGYTSDSTIQNVGVINSYIKGGTSVGGVVGYNSSSTVTNCYNLGTVTGSGSNVGGVVGRNYGTITNCYNTGTVSGSYYVGGVVADNAEGTITNCYNTGTVKGSGYVGGVVGYNYSGIITNCYNIGKVTGSADSVGGVVGYNNNSTITNCYNTGTVTGIGKAGGVVGYNF